MNSEILSSIPLKHIFENSTIASMIILDKDGIIINSNKAMESSYGYSQDDLVGHYFGMLFTLEDKLKQLPEVELATVIEKGSMSDINYVLNKERIPIWTNGETTLCKTANGDVFFVKIIYDLQKEKLLEGFLTNANQQLNEKNERLENINKEQESFVYMASHDLKGPINNIESLVGIIKEALPVDYLEKTKEIFGMVYISIEKFKSVIHELSLVGKDNLNTQTQASHIYFSEILEEIKLALREEISQAQVVFFEDFLKSSIDTIPARSLRSIFYNLVSNAIKYRSPLRRPEIKISTKEEEGHLILRFSDNGAGISEEQRKEIFKIYYRLEETKHIEGSGVGLSIVEKIVLNHKGKIEVESLINVGTTFIVTLPLQ